jgi:hypothetical protein
MPEGRVGKIPTGLFQTLCWLSQKHLWHSAIKEREEGDSLKTDLTASFCMLKEVRGEI